MISQLLDAVVGTKEMIAIRQDYCRLWDCLMSADLRYNIYFTGSKSEGLDLPGSDEDYMIDRNVVNKINITQSLDDNDGPSLYTTFFMSTENVPPGFTLLQHLHQTPMNSLLYQASQHMYCIPIP